ncbi:tRNA (adenine(58)-N(1))-methyltransferase, mitochondrial isoform X2 [Cynoglossus semilaevis]|uniref:tRNA (adenine(58)-N(1))-methyltransferase, mitochondrial isoform X2 n=1 Tax=Cynoglossus semilaevis TaxID=244447 RepID=UPI00049751F3|nr:tRNA (adenine(58)-N(1))-methyltransferase, mitochondrial isoform X2 [Cynoglossus semilaevis]
MLKTSIRTLLLTHRVVRICTSCQIHAWETNILFKLTESRTFSTGSVKCHDNEEEYLDSSRVSSTLTREDSLVTRGSRKRPLSPLERVSRLLPQDALSPEVMQLREQDRQRPDGDIEMSVAHLEHEADQPLQSLVAEETPPENSVHFNQLSSSESGAAVVLPGENLLVFGEILMAELYKKNQVEFRKMFTLKAGVLLQSSWGVILHDDIVGKPAGVVLKTNRGVPIFIRRVSLEDYVLHMRRGPAITYPKDAAVMLMMMDVKEGDCVLESGSGSGAMSLFLSRTVGSKGRVLSIDVREDHLKRATKNCKRWRTSWNLQHREEWPDNIQFHHADLCKASSLLAGHRFNAIALDLVNPHLGLPTALQHLHPGCVCAVYLVKLLTCWRAFDVQLFLCYVNALLRFQFDTGGSLQP